MPRCSQTAANADSQVKSQVHKLECRMEAFLHYTATLCGTHSANNRHYMLEIDRVIPIFKKPPNTGEVRWHLATIAKRRWPTR